MVSNGTSICIVESKINDLTEEVSEIRMALPIGSGNTQSRQTINKESMQQDLNQGW
jgi:hypothetical protein